MYPVKDGIGFNGVDADSTTRRLDVMDTYLIITRLEPSAVSDPADLKNIAETVKTKIRERCPGVHWKDSYATLGRFDVFDIVECDDPKEVERAAMIIRAYGHGSTETLLATPWREFLDAM